MGVFHTSMADLLNEEEKEFREAEMLGLFREDYTRKERQIKRKCQNLHKNLFRLAAKYYALAGPEKDWEAVRYIVPGIHTGLGDIQIQTTQSRRPC